MIVVKTRTIIALATVCTSHTLEYVCAVHYALLFSFPFFLKSYTESVDSTSFKIVGHHLRTRVRYVCAPVGCLCREGFMIIFYRSLLKQRGKNSLRKIAHECNV